MRGYGRVDENLDEYENDELDDYEDIEGDEYGYEEEEEAVLEEEDPASKKEVQKYLELRQKLKEAARKKSANQSGSVSNARDNKRSKLENFGSFFGPSRPVIAERVIQESKSFLETRQEIPRLPSSHTDSRKSQVSGTSAPRNGMTERRPHNPAKAKVQILKDTRDYSFLLSDDAEVPRAANVPPARNNSAGVSAQVPLKRKQSGQVGRQISNGSGERRPVAANSHIRPGQNPLNQKQSLSIRPDTKRSATPENRKHYPVSGHGNGTGRPAMAKEGLLKRDPHLMKKAPSPLERRVAGASTDRRAPSALPMKKSSVAVPNAAMPNGQRSHLLKPQIHGVRQHSEERMVQSSKGKIMPKQTSSSLKPQMKAPKQIPPRYSREDSSYRGKPVPPQKPQQKPKPVRRLPDDEDDDGQAILEIRKMFGYNPNRYAGDDDDLSDMEADFRTIQMEEKRSSRIAREEDEREYMLIQEEEEREKQRKLARKRKMGQR